MKWLTCLTRNTVYAQFSGIFTNFWINGDDVIILTLTTPRARIFEKPHEIL